MRKLIFSLMMLLLASALMSQELSDYSVTVDYTTYTSIASTGTQLTNVYGDYANQTFSLPFSFEFGTKSIARGTNMCVRSDGHVLINLSGTYSGSDYGYNYWPTSSSYNYCAIVPYTNDDGYMPSNTSAVYWQVEESNTGDSILVVEFVDVEHYIDNGEAFNYQLRIYQNGDISVTYGAMTGSSSYANFMMTANDTYDRVLLAGSWSAPTPACPPQMTYLSGAPTEGTVITYVRPTDYCARPASLAVSAVTSNEATVSWIGNDDAIVYTYEYDLVDFVPGSGTHNEGSTNYNSIDLTGLSAQTNYYFYVKSECNNGEESSYASITFRTACGEVTDIPWVEGFEDASSINCWTLLDHNNSINDNWTRYSSYSHSGNYSMRSSYNSSAAANEWLITPPIVIPSDAEGMILRWFVRGSSYSNNIAHYTVRVSTTGNTTADFTDSLFAESYSNSTYVERTVNLDNYAGETVYIAFIHDSYNDNGLYLDDISVHSTLPPVVSISGPTLVSEGEDAVFHATMSEGSENGLQYTWTSSMANNGYAYLMEDGDSVTVTYTAGGLDTIQVTATNNYGSATATYIVRVCGILTTFPWEENFDNADALECWSILDFNNSTYDNWTRYSGSSYSHSGSYSMKSSFNSNANANEWLITPPISVPFDAEGMTLKWYVRGSTYNSNIAHYTVLISTAGNNAEDFTDTLYAETYGDNTYVERMASLNTYAGETIFIAFIHDSYNDSGIYLDDISIYSALPPTVSISGPTIAYDGVDILYTASIAEGSDNGIYYEWTSTMANNGTAILTDNGETAMLYYYFGGIDTIQVVAYNIYGSDTAYMIVQVCSTIIDFPWEENFDNADITCWTILDLNNSNNDNWARYLSSNYSHSGSYSMRSNYNSNATPNDWLITPPIVIPSDAEGLTLKWFVRGSTYSGNTAHYTVRLSTTGNNAADFTNTLFAEEYGNSTYEARMVNLDSYAGETVYIAFIHDSYNDNGLYLDDISVYYSLPPVVNITGPTQAYEGVETIFQAILNEGSENGIQYDWTSTMEAAGNAILVPNNNSASITYNSGGTDTIQLIASNMYGSDTTYHVVFVCGTITDIPWVESFENAANLDCWTILDLDGSSNDNWSRYYSSYSSHTGTYSMRSYYNSSSAANDWLITPAVEIPTNAEGLVLTWFVKGSTFSSNVSHYSVKISTTGNNVADFTTTLFEESYGEDYINRSASLENYAGERIYIAFIHDSYNDNGIYLDDIAVRSALVPVVTLTAPATAMIGENITLTANLTEGSSNGLTYSWSNTLNSTLTPAGNNATVVYNTGGTDYIQVIASNAYGADTAYATITVLDCNPVTTFPWSENFESGVDAIQCWTIIDNNNYTDDNWIVISNGTDSYSYEGNYCLAGPYHEYGSCDDYIISPAIVIPSYANNLWLSYYIRGGEYEGNATSYRTLISTSGTAINNFTDILINETYAGGYVQRSFPLAAYAGQTIHFAFHQTSYDANNMFIDNILIEHVQTPVECNAPSIINASASDSTVTITWTGDADSYTVAINTGSWSEPAMGITATGFTYTFTGLSAGTLYSFGIRSNCADGQTSSWVIQQITTTSTTPPIGITDLSDMEAKIYPNPASQTVTIEVPGLKQLEIMDISGRTIFAETDIDSNKHQLDISTIASGVYFIRLKSDKYMSIRKLVIDK